MCEAKVIGKSIIAVLEDWRCTIMILVVTLLSPLAVYGCDLSGVECGLFIVPLFIVTTTAKMVSIFQKRDIVLTLGLDGFLVMGVPRD